MTAGDGRNGYLSGRAALAGVMGWPVGHSLSPRLHDFWLRQHGINGAYLLGDNTDGYGFIASLAAGAPGWRAAAGPAVLLGAGGAARAIAVALIDAGTPELRLVNRTLARAETLAAQLADAARERGAALAVLHWQDEDALAGAALLVNTTSLGMSGQPPLEVDLAALPGRALVTDIVYNPLETGLLAAARARGHPVVDGLGLLHQARPGFPAWFGVDPEVGDALRTTVLAELG